MASHSSASKRVAEERSVFSQMFPPAPPFTEKDLPSLSGKVILITGATSGVGLSLAKIVYTHGASVKITGRSSDKIELALREIRNAEKIHESGNVEGFILDLADLASLKEAAAKFLKVTQRLDVLVHNAGVMKPPKGSKTKLGHDLEMGTNCLGPYLLNHFLETILLETAASAQANSVRILWVASLVAVGTTQDGIRFDEKSGNPQALSNPMEHYMQSKVGNIFLASETGKRLKDTGIINLSLHPGLLKTELNRHAPKIQQRIMGAILKPSIYGAYTELFAALSPEIKTEDNGAFIVPWGNFSAIPGHIEKGMRSEKEGGTGLAVTFVAWCEREVAQYK